VDAVIPDDFVMRGLDPRVHQNMSPSEAMDYRVNPRRFGGSPGNDELNDLVMAPK
jgi:hypothetical protein